MGGIESGIAGFFSIIFIFYVLYLLIDAEGKRIRKEKRKRDLEMFEILVVCLLIYIAIKLYDIDNNNFPKF